MSEIARCQLCGEPMPPGEEVFNFHGYSGPCPKPPLPKVERPTPEMVAAGFCREHLSKLTMGGGVPAGVVTALAKLIADERK